MKIINYAAVFCATLTSLTACGDLPFLGADDKEPPTKGSVHFAFSVNETVRNSTIMRPGCFSSIATRRIRF